MSTKTAKKEQAAEKAKAPAQEKKETMEAKNAPAPSKAEEKPVELSETVKRVLSQNAAQETVYIGANGGIFFDSPMIKGIKGLKKVKNPFYKG